jgi:ribosomal protein S18 acetylase RimI-like enzyme
MGVPEEHRNQRSTYEVEIIRVREPEIPMLYDLLEWRRTGDETERPPQHASRDNDEKERVLAVMREHIGAESVFVWAARFGQWFVGYISVAKIIKPDPRVYFYIDELWVPKPFRRHGIASALLQATIQTAKAMNMWCIRLVAANTPAVRDLYRKAGFEVNEQTGWGEMTFER